MNRLVPGVELFHGSYCAVESVDLYKCRTGKDFGRGFYLSTSYEQAKDFVRMSVRNAVKSGILPATSNEGYVSSFIYRPTTPLDICYFEKYDAEWLHFVSGNRDSSLFSNMIVSYSRYDIIVGKIANDKTAAVLSQYINGLFGSPGDVAADEIAIRLLLPDRLNDQYCFRSMRAISALCFKNAVEVKL